MSLPLKERFKVRFRELYWVLATWSWGRILVTLVGAVGLVGGSVVGALWYVASDLPALDTLQEHKPSLVSRVYSDDRKIMGQFYVERRILTPLSEVPQPLVEAVIAVEDARFFEHPGMDIIGILRAIWTNVRRGGRVEGASTITQQLARSLFLTPERTYLRKFKELILAYKIELILNKEQILEMYLNQIYFGQGAYGVVAAAQTYFGKELAQLTLAESAFLAGLPKSPNNYSPFKYLERAKKRQEHVLMRMEEATFITPEERQEAVGQPLAFRHMSSDQIAPYFMEYIRQQLMTRYGETMVYKGGLEIFTTLNVDLQKAAEQAVHAGLLQLDKRQGWRGPIGTQDLTTLTATPAPTTPSRPVQVGDLMQGVVTKVARDHVVVMAGSITGRLAFEDMAWGRRRLHGKDPTKDFTTVQNPKLLLKPGDVVEVGVKKVDRDLVLFQLEQTPVVEGALIAIDPRTGSIRAMVGGYDFARSEYNRAVLAHRQPGSAFKPIIYATAMNEGLSPATLVVDAPVVYEQDDPEKIWKPENYDKRSHGVVSLRDALIHSRNLATVRLLEKVGIRNVIEFAKTLGIASPLSNDLSLALGSSSVSLLELTSAYGVFANQGLRLEPYALALVQDTTGATLEQASFEPRSVVSKETTYLITNMMEDVIQRGTGQMAKSIGRPIAGKTGTTNDFTDAWFVGFTPNLAVGVWVGFDDLRPLGETESGAHAALPIWIDFMREALPQLPLVPFEIPDDILFVRVDPGTGLLAPDQGDQGTVEIFAKGTEPTQPAPQRTIPTDFYRVDQVQEPVSTAPPPALQP
jgi:penicillin-binding protein 1A